MCVHDRFYLYVMWKYVSVGCILMGEILLVQVVYPYYDLGCSCCGAILGVKVKLCLGCVYCI